MSVKTQADRNIDSAKEHLREVSVLLADVLINECPGYHEFAPDYEAILWQVMESAKKLERKL